MYKKSAIEIRDLFLSKKASSEEITKYFLNRISKADPKINAFLSIFEEKALVKARELDKKLKEKKPLGKLASIPLAIKDNIHIKGEKTTCASKYLSNSKALFNASIIDHLIDEDSIIIGKTNLDEFAMGSSNENSAFFSCKNPWDLNSVAGGSSGGSAAAVASRMTPLSFGSDTGGSIRYPAALNGIYGFKPTYGRVSRYGLVAFGSSLDQIGPLANSAKDIALSMEVISRPCNKDSTNFRLPEENYLHKIPKDFKKIKIGVPYHFLENLNKNTKNNFDRMVDDFKNLGAEIIDINLDILKYSIAIYYIIATAEASTNLARYDGIKYGERAKNTSSLEELYSLSREEGFGKEVKRRILLPTNAKSAFKLGSISNPLDMYLEDLFTIPANLAALPAITIPYGFDNSKPLGVQLIAPQLMDVKLIQYTILFENLLKTNEKIAPLFDKEF